MGYDGVILPLQSNLKENDSMFTKGELSDIAAALMVQSKSVARLAAKEGQPESVAIEYRKVGSRIDSLYKKVVAEMDKEVKK